MRWKEDEADRGSDGGMEWRIFSTKNGITWEKGLTTLVPVTISAT